MSRTRIGALLESANSVDILLYVHNNPLCLKSEIYRNVSRNAHTREKMDMLRTEGLLAMEPGDGGRCLLSLTEKGEAVTELLVKIEKLLVNDT